MCSGGRCETWRRTVRGGMDQEVVPTGLACASLFHFVRRVSILP